VKPIGTYDHKRVLADYANGKITAEMAVGHCLQHIDQLYAAQEVAADWQRAWQAKVNQLVDDLKALRAAVNHWQKEAAKADRLRTLENNLTALNVTVYQIKNDVDHLQARLSNADEENPSAKN
jgi:outer membrane murein-binding lipoprotein Lpp